MAPHVALLVAAGLVVLALAAVFGGRLIAAFRRYRGTRVVVCPESRELVAVELDARRAARSALSGRPELRLDACTRWPERAGCGQECLGQIESAPEACLLRNILADWYVGKRCALCGRAFHAVRWHDHAPGLRTPGGSLVTWQGFRPERVIDVLATHAPVCWDCRVAETFRAEHPELVTDRPPRLGPPPSMA